VVLQCSRLHHVNPVVMLIVTDDCLHCRVGQKPGCFFSKFVAISEVIGLLLKILTVMTIDHWMDVLNFDSTRMHTIVA